MTSWSGRRSGASSKIGGARAGRIWKPFGAIFTTCRGPQGLSRPAAAGSSSSSILKRTRFSRNAIRSGRAEGWGALYRFDLATRQSTLLDTGVANRNNNDHVLSFDGAMLGISDQSQASGGRSTVYTVPVGGGTPKRITTLSPSYLHSWSPDGKDLIFTGGRNNEYDIYRIPADGSGPEVNLTNFKGSGADHERRVQQLVPAHLAGRPVDRDDQLPEGGDANRSSVLQACVPAADATRRRRTQSDRAVVSYAGFAISAWAVARLHGRNPQLLLAYLTSVVAGLTASAVVLEILIRRAGSVPVPHPLFYFVSVTLPYQWRSGFLLVPFIILLSGLAAGRRPKTSSLA